MAELVRHTVTIRCQSCHRVLYEVEKDPLSTLEMPYRAIPHCPDPTHGMVDIFYHCNQPAGISYRIDERENEEVETPGYLTGASKMDELSRMRRAIEWCAQHHVTVDFGYLEGSDGAIVSVYERLANATHNALLGQGNTFIDAVDQASVRLRKRESEV